MKNKFKKDENAAINVYKDGRQKRWVFLGAAPYSLLQCNTIYFDFDF